MKLLGLLSTGILGVFIIGLALFAAVYFSNDITGHVTGVCNSFSVDSDYGFFVKGSSIVSGCSPAFVSDFCVNPCVVGEYVGSSLSYVNCLYGCVDGACLQSASNPSLAQYCADRVGGQDVEDCDNGEDDDNDGLKDCEDSDCENAPNCVVGGGLIAKPFPDTYYNIMHVWLESNIPGADIYYTLDGSTPTVNSQEYFGAVELRDSKTVKAIAVLPGSSAREDFTGKYIIQKSSASITVNGPTYIEAEASKDYQNFVARPDSRASNGEYMLVLNQQNGSLSYLKYAFTASPGKYYVWARTQMQDSWGTLTVDVDGIVSPYFYTGPEDRTVNGWSYHWIPTNPPGYQLSGNNHVLKINKHWRSTTKVDRILITNDPNFEPPEIAVIRPAGGEVLVSGGSETIKWESSGTLANVKIEYSLNNGNTWQILVSSTENNGIYTWQNVPTGKYQDARIRISDVTDSKSMDESDNTFRIDANKEWYTGGLTLRSRLSSTYNKPYDYDHKDDRTSFLNYMEELGKKKLSLWWRFDGIKLVEWNPYKIYFDREALDRFRLYNEDKSDIIIYGNMFSVHAFTYGEGVQIPPILGRMGGSYPEEWKLKDINGEQIYNSNYPIDPKPECDVCRNTNKNCEGCMTRANLFFGHKDFQKFYADSILNAMSVGYNGAFFDSFEPLNMKNFENGDLKYVNGETIKVIDSRTGQLYEAETWMNDVRKAMYNIRKLVDRDQGNKEAIFILNGLQHTVMEEYSDLIEGALKEGFCSVMESWPGVPLSDFWYTNQMCETDINALINAENQGLTSVLGFGPVKGQHENGAQAAYYSMATGLLGIKGPDTKAYYDSWSIDFNAWKGFDLPLSMFIPEGRYEERDDDVLSREFQKAFVYVNPTKSDKYISFGGSYYYLTEDGVKSTNKISSTTLKPNRAIILFKS